MKSDQTLTSKEKSTPKDVPSIQDWHNMAVQAALERQEERIEVLLNDFATQYTSQLVERC